jgi:phytoene dehydrogenase-like protein
MNEPRVIIIGGGLAGLAAGCYTQSSGMRATVVEHNIALGGVCTAWQRGPYTIDGCIHWLTGGAFARIYDELGITTAVPLRTLDHFTTYRNEHEHFEVEITQDLGAFARQLIDIAPEDQAEILRMMDGALEIAELAPPIDHPVELSGLRETLTSLWNMREQASTLVHFRKPLATWASERLTSPRLQRLFSHVLPAEAPAFFGLMVLGYLSRGWLSRPVGGTARFRDALIASYAQLGGDVRLHATVDEILVQDGRACGVRLDDGSMLEADIVISTASAPETVLRLLGGRYGAADTRRRLEHWRTFQPIVLASFGVATPLEGTPQMLLVDGLQPFTLCGRTSEHLYLRVYNDDPSFAPPGHSVVQAMIETDYEWWATRGSRYGAEKDTVAEQALSLIDGRLPGTRAALRVHDIATPLTYWQNARSWRGAYEGWYPTPEAFFGHIDKRLPGLRGFYMAGQWVEPGGGVPPALMSGRQAVQLACAELARPFTRPALPATAQAQASTPRRI